MGYRNKTYVCFDGDSDIHMYRLMQAWKANDNFDFNFYDAHDFNNIWFKSNEETIKRRLRERMNSAKVLVVLIGESTKYLYKYVRYEIQLAIDAGIPIIAVNLNKKNEIDDRLCPAIIRENLSIHIPFGQSELKRALEEWPSYHEEYKKNGDTRSYIYK